MWDGLSLWWNFDENSGLQLSAVSITTSGLEKFLRVPKAEILDS